mmetsp:Transcript_23474/g.44438  ORF Transcript_23474/g.44438 Transcript_23474/m.44438 type:complete len:87 (-) Transcript_23474:27-287(-)
MKSERRMSWKNGYTIFVDMCIFLSFIEMVLFVRLILHSIMTAFAHDQPPFPLFVLRHSNHSFPPTYFLMTSGISIVNTLILLNFNC